MTQQIIDKRTADNRTITVDCRGVLNPSETISSVLAVAADEGSLAFGTAVVNAAPVAIYNAQGVQSDTVPIGQAIQIPVSAGTIPPGSPFLLCVTRAKLQTTLNAAVEATFGIRLIDLPVF